MKKQTQRQVWQAVCACPGLNKTELVRRTGLSWSTAGHHLGILERHGAVHLVRSGRTVHAIPAEFAEHLRQWPVLVCPEKRRILGMLLASPDLGSTDLGRRLGMTRKQVRRHIYDLVDAGLAKSDGSYHSCYGVTGEGCAAAECLAFLDPRFREVVDLPTADG